MFLLVTAAGVLLVGALISMVAGRVWFARRRPAEVTHCAFCKRTRHEVQRLIAAEDQTAICGDCIRLSAELLDQEVAALAPGPTPPPPGPPGDPWTPPDDQSMSSK